ncbi:hypothetical protein D5272_12365 [bacterium D16-76]|nr:hypothetical protein [bacterium D16-76]
MREAKRGSPEGLGPLVGCRGETLAGVEGDGELKFFLQGGEPFGGPGRLIEEESRRPGPIACGRNGMVKWHKG